MTNVRKKLVLVCVALFMTGCGRSASISTSDPAAGDRLIENIQVENYFQIGPNQEYFKEVPRRVLVIGANEAETIMDIGVGDSIMAIADGQNNKNYGIKEQNRTLFDSIPKLSRAEMNAEHVLQMQPDMIVGQQEFYTKNRLGSTKYWNSKGIYTMVPFNTTSPGKLNQKETLEKEMKFIRDMGVIFHKEKNAEKIISDTMGRIHMIQETIKGQHRPTVMILDRMSILASYGREKIAGDMAASIGGIVPDTTAAVSDELIMKVDPQVVFLVTYGDPEPELARIRDKPTFRNLSFIKNQRLYPIPLKYVYGPQTRTIDAIGYMAERMYPGQFSFPKEYVRTKS